MSITSRLNALESKAGTPAGSLGARVFVNYPKDPADWLEVGTALRGIPEAERTHTGAELEQFERDGWQVKRIQVVYVAKWQGGSDDTH